MATDVDFAAAVYDVFMLLFDEDSDFIMAFKDVDFVRVFSCFVPVIAEVLTETADVLAARLCIADELPCWDRDELVLVTAVALALRDVVDVFCDDARNAAAVAPGGACPVFMREESGVDVRRPPSCSIEDDLVIRLVTVGLPWGLGGEYVTRAPDREVAVALLGVTGLASGLMMDRLSVLELDKDRDRVSEEPEEERVRARRGVAGLASGLVGGVLPVLPNRNTLEPVDWLDMLDILDMRVLLDDLLDEDVI
ncbi:Hypp8605 [Branchiostoma lanceolatum]|uniref:Hypp8605 protein n=1 Tax=Branchiostoma lanceolatum TaxID=7740 RepID=A0A8J9Z840_BRALA|nr:Hypp8605 [Branchiostoma lanceolatum]